MHRFENALDSGSKWKCILHMHIVLVWMVKNASKWKQLRCHMYHVGFTQAFFASESIYQSTIIECFSVKAGLVWKLKAHQNGIVDACVFIFGSVRNLLTIIYNYWIMHVDANWSMWFFHDNKNTYFWEHISVERAILSCLL